MKILYLEVTDRCNLKCDGCYREYADKEYNTDMSYLDVCKVLEQVPKEVKVVPFLDGEPFLHPDIGKIVQKISSMGFRYEISTNGTVKNDALIDFMMSDINCSGVYVSMDGLWSIKSSRGIDLEKPLGMVHELVRVRDQYSRVPVGVTMLFKKQDFDEVTSFISWGFRADVDEVIIRRPLVQGFTGYPLEPHCNYIDKHLVTVKANGDVPLCERQQDVEILGNAFKEPLEEIVKRQVYKDRCYVCPQRYSDEKIRGYVRVHGDSYYFQQDYYNTRYRKEAIWGM
jgi:MoaA/NifB/PqqE/SkfB family radical SAM enzyme